MVASVLSTCGGLLTAGLATAMSLSACGGASSQSDGAGGSAGMRSSITLDGQGGFVAAAGAGPDALLLDGPDCKTRRAADCTGLSSYSSSFPFDGTSELSECSAYVSFDGCGQLIYEFDPQGCATSVGPGPGGWQESGHLARLRDCLSAAFADARFSCLASRQFGFYESCFIR